jgi:hypothetical protein
MTVHAETFSIDSEEQKKTFNEDPERYNKYCREIEGELNKRFTLVSSRGRHLDALL